MFVRNTAIGILSYGLTTLLNMGIAEVLTQAISPEVEGMIQSAGGRPIPGTAWVIPLSPQGGA